MDSNYMFLCGVMWCKYGQQEAGKELLRAANSGDPDMSALAWAMLAKGARRLSDLERRARTSPRDDPRGKIVWMRSRAICIFVCRGRSRGDEV
jgi:hypothetical protein